MPKTVRNLYDKKLTYENLMKAHKNSRKGKGYRIEVIDFNLKQEEYIMWLYKELKNMTYKHGGYQVFYITEPKVRKIEKSRYIDRIVHRWIVDEILIPTFVPTFINTSFACLKDKGMHRAALYVQKAMRSAKQKWNNYYILKMDILKYFDSIDKEILFNIIKRKIKDEKILDLIKKILYSQDRPKSLEIGNYTSQMFRKYFFKRARSICKT